MLKFLGWVVLLIAVSGCDKQETIANGCFKGKLVIKGICKNDVVQLVEGKSDALLVESSWRGRRGRPCKDILAWLRWVAEKNARSNYGWLSAFWRQRWVYGLCYFCLK